MFLYTNRAIVQDLDLSLISKYLKGRVSILVAEDEKINQRIATLILGKIGLQVDIANDGEEVLEMFQKKFYDIVLMDYQMPKLNGIETAKRLLEVQKKKPYVIALTANTAEDNILQYYQAGMRDFIAKPYTAQVIVDGLNRYIQNNYM